MILIDLPKDILLEVVKFLELPDPLSLLLTCSSIYTLSNQRGFWISILETTRAKSPIACPQHADLSLYGSKALKVLVVSWMKLQDNWNKPFPQIRWPAIWYTRFVAPTQIVFNVQGTEIIVVNDGTVYCWDAESMQRLPFPAIEVGPNRRSIGSVSAPIEGPGVWTLAFLADRLNTAGLSVTHLYIITIKHDGGKVTSFTNECHQLSVTQGTHFHPVFLTEDVAGTVVAGNNQDCCIISVGPLSALRCPLPSTIVLKLHRPVSDHDLVATCVYKGHLYILLDDPTSVYIYHIPRKSLRSGHCEEYHFQKSHPVLRSHRHLPSLGGQRSCFSGDLIHVPAKQAYLRHRPGRALAPHVRRRLCHGICLGYTSRRITRLDGPQRLQRYCGPGS
ncbi:hypothetical protein C8R47DRAFT_435613 [Mycena vitilis]|nr:hypothetical protein C8R47DRAFT_435613 [Mycena vitilis]